MANVSANSLAGFLQVYAQESLKQFIADMPNINLFTKNFDTEITNGGTSVVTRIPTTIFGTPNDLTQGWGNTQASSSAVTTTLKLRNYDMVFNELEWATITPSVLTNTYLPSLTKQLANGIVVDALNNVTTSLYTNVITVASSAAFGVTGSNSLQTAATLLSNLEIPEEGRYSIVSPTVYQGLTNGIIPTYVFGNSDVVQKNKVQELLGFQMHKYPRFTGATLPAGGSKYSNGDKLVGICGNSQGLVCAVRQPVDVQGTGLVQSATATDPTSGLSLQVRMVYDASKPAWRIAVVTCFGTSVGNTNGIIPIITAST